MNINFRCRPAVVSTDLIPPPRLLLPTLCRCSGLLLHLITLSDTHLVGLPLDAGSARNRDVHHVPGGIRICSPSRQAATDRKATSQC